MNALKVHVKSKHTEDYTPCGIHTDRISNYPPDITCLRCRTKPEFHKLVRWYADIAIEQRKKKAQKVRDLEVGLKIGFSDGDESSVGFYRKDIEQVILSEKYLSVVTKDGANIYPLLHVVDISMSRFIFDSRYKER